ncbi:MAG: DUF3341 domain-containing protein [Cyanobacteria bacterium PR.3.49]|jgi:hypothetical protein|nr:DUF3341 domain-containing protein [Cyanobacteria bacterium PR.3.49]
MKQSVAGIVKTRLEAENLVNALRANGFADHEISALFPDKEGSKDFAHDNSTKAPEGTVAGVGTGGLLGGVLGLMAGIGAIAVPGVGPLIAAGPIMATLSGAAVGATVGGIAGALIGMGIPEYEAKMYEGKIRDGNILLAVHCNNNDELKRAEELYKQHNVSDIHRVGEASVKKSA